MFKCLCFLAEMLFLFIVYVRIWKTTTDALQRSRGAHLFKHNDNHLREHLSLTACEKGHTECHGAVPFLEIFLRPYPRQKDTLMTFYTLKGHRKQRMWFCVSIVRCHEIEMSIPPQNTPFWPQMTTDFTLASLSARFTVSTMPCLTAALYRKDDMRFYMIMDIFTEICSSNCF